MNKSDQLGCEKKLSSQGILKFFTPIDRDWRCLEESCLPDELKNEHGKGQVKANNDSLREMLSSALQMPNLIVLAGSGTSLGAGGPRMWDLWDHAINKNPGLPDNEQRDQTDEARAIIDKIRFDAREGKEGENIEALLSRCEAWLQINDSDKDVKEFVKNSKKIILDKCQTFLQEDKLNTHCSFLHKLSRRSVRNPRLKVFTTNYDLCFERAAARQGLIVIDGFSLTQPRKFNPLFFGYDVVRRLRVTEEHGDYLEGVFHLLKMHGSVNWEYTQDGAIQEKENPDASGACLIYPARGKYQKSYVQPHLELVSQFFASLREPDTCLMVAGFGFNDDHLSEPILAAVKSNPRLKVVIVDFRAEDSTNGVNDKASRYWRELFKLARDGVNIWFVNAGFEQFVSLIPDMKTLSPAQQIENAFRRLKEGV
jgi:hypothetical protein